MPPPIQANGPPSRERTTATSNTYGTSLNGSAGPGGDIPNFGAYQDSGTFGLCVPSRAKPGQIQQGGGEVQFLVKWLDQQVLTRLDKLDGRMEDLKLQVRAGFLQGVDTANGPLPNMLERRLDELKSQVTEGFQEVRLQSASQNKKPINGVNPERALQATPVDVAIYDGADPQEKDGRKTRRPSYTHVAHHEHHWADVYSTHPHSKFAHIWTTSVALGVLYVCWEIPFVLGFTWWRKTETHGALGKALDIFFLFDMLQSFRSGFEHDGHIIRNFKEIAKHYLGLWFWVDLAANFPWETLIGALITDKKQRKSFKALKFMKLSKLLRLARLVKIINSIGGGRGHLVNLIAKVAILFVSVHACACCWVKVRGPCDAYPPGDVDWSYTSEIDEALVIEDPALGLQCTQRYVFSLYGEALHVGATVVLGQGLVRQTHDDILEGKVSSLLFFVLTFWQFVGVLFLGNLFAQLAKILFQRNFRECLFWLRQDTAKTELEEYGGCFTEQLRHRIYARFRLQFKQAEYGPLQILSSGLLPCSLRLEVAFALYGDLVCSIPALTLGMAPGLTESFCLALVSENYLQHEFVYCLGQPSSGFYILDYGVINVVRGQGQRDVTKVSAHTPEEAIRAVPPKSIFGSAPVVKQLVQELHSGTIEIRDTPVHGSGALCLEQSHSLFISTEDLRKLSLQYNAFLPALIDGHSEE